MHLAESGENLRWSLLTTAKFRCAGRPVARWRRIVRVSRGSWSLSWQKYTTRPPISACRRRAVRILATRNRRGRNPQGCWPNAMTGSALIRPRGGPRHGPPRPPALGALRETRGAPRPCARSSGAALGGAGTRRQDRLQRHAQGDARGAADEVVPEVADVERGGHHDHEGLRGHGPEEHRAAAHATEEERHQEEAEQDAVEDRAEDVDGLDEVLREPGEERERHREDAPERGEASRHAYVARLVSGGERADVAPEVDCRGGAERGELGGLR